MPVLYCQPCYGLGNRLMALSSCIRIAKRLNYDIKVIWDSDTALSCDYDAIFGEKFELVAPPPMEPYQNAEGNPRFLLDLNRVNGRDVFIKYNHFVFTQGDFAELTQGEDVMAARVAFTRELQEAWAEIKPSDEVLRRASAEPFDLGIHVRRATHIDHTDWARPDDAYLIELSTAFIQQNNVKSVYFSSNSHDTLTNIGNALNGLGIRVETSKASGWELNNEHQIEAYVDMINLTRCRMMIRRDISTFSALASLMTCNVELVYTPDGQFFMRQPVILSGSAL